MSNSKICKKIQVELPCQLMRKATLNLFHKMNTSKYPQALMNLLKKQRRKCMNIQLQRNFKSKRGRRSPMAKMIKMYNALPTNLKSLPVKPFKKRLKKLTIDEVPD